jgi:hypothetical protein
MTDFNLFPSLPECRFRRDSGPSVVAAEFTLTAIKLLLSLATANSAKVTGDK